MSVSAKSRPVAPMQISQAGKGDPTSSPAASHRTGVLLAQSPFVLNLKTTKSKSSRESAGMIVKTSLPAPAISHFIQVEENSLCRQVAFSSSGSLPTEKSVNAKLRESLLQILRAVSQSL